MRLIFFTFVSLFSTWAFAQVPEIRGLKVAEPQVWTPGLNFCYWTDPEKKLCATLSTMNEIELRMNGQPGTNAEEYMSRLPLNMQMVANEYDKLVVRYLATGSEDNFILQVLFTVVGKGSQALYIFGTVENGEVRAEAYGGANLNEFSERVRDAARMVAGIDDQTIVNIALETANLYLKRQTISTPDVKRP